MIGRMTKASVNQKNAGINLLTSAKESKVHAKLAPVNGRNKKGHLASANQVKSPRILASCANEHPMKKYTTSTCEFLD